MHLLNTAPEVARPWMAKTVGGSGPGERCPAARPPKVCFSLPRSGRQKRPSESGAFWGAGPDPNGTAPEIDPKTKPVSRNTPRSGGSKSEAPCELWYCVFGTLFAPLSVNVGASKITGARSISHGSGTGVQVATAAPRAAYVAV